MSVPICATPASAGKPLIRIFWAALIAAGMTAPARAATVDDIAAVAALMLGTYDNAAQVAANPKMPRLTTYIRAVDAPAFGDRILYLEEIRDGDPNKIARIRLFKFTTENDTGMIRLHLINPKDAEKLKGAHADLTRVRSLTPDDMRADRGLCDVYIRRVGNSFEGKMSPKSCDRKDDAGNPVFVDYDLIASGATMRIRNRWLSAIDGSPAWELTQGGWLEQIRVGD